MLHGAAKVCCWQRGRQPFKVFASGDAVTGFFKGRAHRGGLGQSVPDECLTEICEVTLVATPEGRPVRRRRNHNRPIVAEIGNEGARMARSGAFSARPSNDRENPSIMGLACGDRRSMSNRALGRLCDGTKFSGLTGECYDLGPFSRRSLGHPMSPHDLAVIHLTDFGLVQCESLRLP